MQSVSVSSWAHTNFYFLLTIRECRSPLASAPVRAPFRCSRVRSRERISCQSVTTWALNYGRNSSHTTTIITFDLIDMCEERFFRFFVVVEVEWCRGQREHGSCSFWIISLNVRLRVVICIPLPMLRNLVLDNQRPRPTCKETVPFRCHYVLLSRRCTSAAPISRCQLCCSCNFIRFKSAFRIDWRRFGSELIRIMNCEMAA